MTAPMDGPRDEDDGSVVRVLVVEDDPSVRALLVTLLASEGYEVLQAGDGIAGLQLATTEYPDLVMLDMMMPDLGGMAFLSELRKTAAMDLVPVLVLTGRVEALPDLREQLGDDNVFLKPPDIGALLFRVAEMTGGVAP